MINTADQTTIGYYVVILLLEPYMLQYDKKIDKQVINAGEVIVKVGCLSTIKSNTQWY